MEHIMLLVFEIYNKKNLPSNIYVCMHNLGLMKTLLMYMHVYY